jgi:hypothetical protein
LINRQGILWKNIYFKTYIFLPLFFCFNLRNKKYCFGNEQLTKEEFENKRKEWDLSSFENYQKAKKFFAEIMLKKAWHRALKIDRCENSTGCFIRNCKDCENCYMLSNHENCANVSLSGPNARWILDSLGTVGAELAFMSVLPVYCYDTRFCFSTDHCRFVEYSAYLKNCQYCFGCCGLVNEKYCIFNKKYSPEEYEQLHAKIVEHMKKTEEWGKFFPSHFAPNPYEESYSRFHFPDKRGINFRTADPIEKITMKTAEFEDIPDSIELLNPEKEKWLQEQIFWDHEYERPFQIQAADIDFARKMRVPLPHFYYINRIQSNFKWMPFNGELRETKCAKSDKVIKTNWPEKYDGRILSEDEYLKVIK